MGRKIGWVASIVVVLLSSTLGLLNGFSDLDVAATALQKSVTYGVLAHGVVGLGAAFALIRRIPAARWLTLLWTALVTYVSSTATLAYAGDGATVGGAIAGGVGAGVIGLLTYWCARTVTRQPNASTGSPTQAVR